MKTLRFVTLSLIVALGFATAGYAQVSTTGTIEVTVLDRDGGVVPGASVVVAATDTVSSRNATTDAEGRARIEGLQPSANYNVTVELSGFRPFRAERVRVTSGQVTTLNSELTVGGLTETVQVTAGAPLVDVTSAVSGQDITLELTESLPTGRSYQSYLQLVPGVMPDNQLAGGNPAVRSGMNYNDASLVLGDNVGVSTDNAFYFDGINVTDPVNGRFGANLNTEIIQEQKVITGGIPAEFVGVAGLISNVITKSGSNTFSGSANYFFQNNNLVSENKHGEGEEFSTNDTAFTFGGPLLRDRAWFYSSYRHLTRDDDVSTLDTNTFLRSVERTDKQGFLKGTYAFTSADVVSFTYLSDPTNTSGRRERNITNAQDRSREQGGHRYGGTYSRIFGNALIDISANAHNAEISDFSVIREPENIVAFREGQDRTIADEQLGGYGRDLPENRDTRQIRGSATYTFNRHTLKGGLEWAKHINFRDTLYLGNPPARYTSLPARFGPVPSGDLSSGEFSTVAFDPENPSDFSGFIEAIDAAPNRGAFYSAYDANGDGTITPTELGTRLIYSDTTQNPNGEITYDRTFQSALGPQETSSRGVSFFLQDEFRLNRWTFNVGVRTEQWQHFATTGENIFTFDWEFAPRLSAAYDVFGDGRHRASVYYGRYYDPIRNDMTNFAGTLTGSVLEEQVFANGEWVTYRTRGGPSVQDAFFSPTTQTPYTDDISVGYAADLGNNQSVEATYYHRRSRDIFEDYDLLIYADPEGYPGDINAPDSLFLGLDYFGYTEMPSSNFVIGTLAGGKRDFHGTELVYRKRLANRWQALVSYNWLRGRGNSNSDGDADLQGDVIYLDPRAPNQYGPQPGVISHLIKAAGSYAFDNGLQFGATFGWNSGVRTSRTSSFASRHIPARVTAAEAFEFGGVVERWIAPNNVGTFEHPAYSTFDLRAQYNRRIANVNAEFFVDLFNVFDNQAGILLNDLIAGLGTVNFQDEVQWELPRRAFIGARVRF